MHDPNNPVNIFGITHGLSTSLGLTPNLFMGLSVAQARLPTGLSCSKTLVLSRENRLVHTQAQALSTIAIH